MNYFRIRKSTSLKEVGHIDQIDEGIRLIEVDERDAYQTLNRREWPDPMLPLDIFKLNRAAKLTDVLSCTFTQETVGLVVNEKVKSILESFRLECTKVFPMSIHSADLTKVHEYFLFYVTESRELVDFASSTYFKMDRGRTQMIEEISLRDIDEFYDAYKKTRGGILAPQQIQFNSEPDFFRIPWGVSPYISERLKNALEKAQVTGIDIQPVKLEIMAPK
ncbi:hypothetical protein BFP72_06120 [Reichenbachiella sp. 5M10]|uniref:imm11 family protein n=1 Tax=Reichenbachiella sp. 5M10 TaxID=1889772 RepID=UPI000C1471E6|nr:DUF1629 domain-containing protein [Reichenbachiella sp. 5M10]PIB34997.1 hypothetical protein BFP72_06120 [Reichenbachiella sp. 5M10]